MKKENLFHLQYIIYNPLFTTWAMKWNIVNKIWSLFKIKALSYNLKLGKAFLKSHYELDIYILGFWHENLRYFLLQYRDASMRLWCSVFVHLTSPFGVLYHSILELSQTRLFFPFINLGQNFINFNMYLYDYQDLKCQGTFHFINTRNKENFNSHDL